MSRLTNPSAYVLSETDALRDRRNSLLREAHKHPYRLHSMKRLTDELRAVTNELLKRELEDGQTPEPPLHPEPHFEALGDAGAVGGYTRGRLPYKD